MAKKSKTLQDDSKYAHLDTDGDGIVSDEEMAQADKIMDLEAKRERIENEDKKEDAQRGMGWLCPCWNASLSICCSSC